MDEPQLGERFDARMGWTLPDGNRLQVTFQVCVEELELEKNRMRCRLLGIQAASGSRPESEVDSRHFGQVMSLVGRQALLPLDAREGIVLPLRLETLTGEHRFFFD